MQQSKSKKQQTRQTTVAMEQDAADGNYQKELAYQLEVIRAASSSSAPDEAARLLWDLSCAVAAGELSEFELEGRRALLASVVLEMKDSPELLERFRWANFYKGLPVGDVPQDNHSTFEAEVRIVRVACPWLEPFLGITLQQLKEKIEELESVSDT